MTLALEKIYGEPLPGEVVDVEVHEAEARQPHQLALVPKEEKQ